MTTILFWTAVGLIVYTYVLFPAMIVARGMLIHRSFKAADITPRVSVIICAYNEELNIADRLVNLVGLDYPQEQLEVIVASDGSIDATNDIVRGYGERGVRLLALPRQGKTRAMNAAAQVASGEIIVFSDANTQFAPNALTRLVRPFADPKIGGVAGDQRYLSEAGDGTTGAGERGYWNFDRVMKRYQSRAGNVISATGAIYAIRRDLFEPIPMGVTDDFVASTRVIQRGYRLVFAADAVAYEPVAGSSGVEFGRKVRVITQGIRSVRVMYSLFNPIRHGFYSVQFFSHKVLRRAMVYPLLAVLVLNGLLWNGGLFYQVTFVAQLLFYGLALAGMLLGETRLGRSKPLAIPFFFCMVNAAALMATLRILQGRRIERWEPQRPESGGGLVTGPAMAAAPVERSAR